MEKSVLNVDVSCFESCDSVLPKKVNLLTWLTSEKYRNKVEELRSIQDEKLQKEIKKSLPAITPGGLFDYRNAEHLVRHSGLLCFDIDFQDNTHLRNFNEMKSQLSNISHVAYCGLSVRGKGFWGCIPIPESTPEIHSQRFQALEKDFREFGIILDPSGKDVCRLRIYSWDSEPYINHCAVTYTNIFKPQPKPIRRPGFSETREKVEKIISEITSTGTDITGSYENWLKLACSLANEFGESGRGYFHAVSKFHPEYSNARTDRMFDNVLKHDYRLVSIGTFFHIASEYGIKCAGIKRIASVVPGKNTFEKAAYSDREEVINEVITDDKHSESLHKEQPMKPGPWSSEIDELQNFFASVKIPQEYRLDECTKVFNIQQFLESHFTTVKHQNGNERYLPYMERLKSLKNSIRDEQQN